jgi:Flp pilus assembly protein TadG
MRPAERGSEAINTLVVGFSFFMIVAVIIMAGRLVVAQSAVEVAAAEASRAASIARTQVEANSAAASGAQATLASQDLNCAGTPNVVVDTTGFAAPPGTPATVQATVSCAVSLGDLAFGVLPIPGTQTVTATMSSPIDTYREH